MTVLVWYFDSVLKLILHLICTGVRIGGFCKLEGLKCVIMSNNGPHCKNKIGCLYANALFTTAVLEQSPGHTKRDRSANTTGNKVGFELARA